ncbi:hypothetical protein Kazakh3172_02430 [Helicobacter pylori]
MRFNIPLTTPTKSPPNPIIPHYKKLPLAKQTFDIKKAFSIFEFYDQHPIRTEIKNSFYWENLW